MKPRLHLVCGLPCAGKTTLARQIEEESGVIRLCPDEWIEPLLSSPNNREEMDRLRPHVEILLKDLAGELLTRNVSVILENGFWLAAERLDYLQFGRDSNASVILHLLDPPIDVLKQRALQRNAALPAGSFLLDPPEFDTWNHWFERPDEAELARYDDVTKNGDSLLF